MRHPPSPFLTGTRVEVDKPVEQLGKLVSYQGAEDEFSLVTVCHLYWQTSGQHGDVDDGDQRGKEGGEESSLRFVDIQYA
jgi:hypothetical protein